MTRNQMGILPLETHEPILNESESKDDKPLATKRARTSSIPLNKLRVVGEEGGGG